MERFSIDHWVDQYVDAVMAAFRTRIRFIGLQGSWGRGEATPVSDIDMVLVLDTVDYTDVKKYSQILDNLPYREKSCGFISGCAELEEWEKSDLFQFFNDTTVIFGSLEYILKSIKREDVLRAVKIGACNIYHGCVHNAVHEKRTDVLQSHYKAAAFTLRAIAYLKKGIFARKTVDLMELLDAEDREILRQGARLSEEKCISDTLFNTSSALLIQWASRWIVKSSQPTKTQSNFNREVGTTTRQRNIVTQMVDGIVGKNGDESIRHKLAGRASEYWMLIDEE